MQSNETDEEYEQNEKALLRNEERVTLTRKNRSLPDIGIKKVHGRKLDVKIGALLYSTHPHKVTEKTKQNARQKQKKRYKI